MSNLTAKNDNNSRIKIPPNQRNARSHWAKRQKNNLEEGELATAFNLENEEGNLNFTLLTYNLKITYLLCHIFIWKLKKTLLDFSTFLNKQFSSLK